MKYLKHIMKKKAASEPQISLIIQETEACDGRRRRRLQSISGENFLGSSQHRGRESSGAASAPPCCMVGEHFLTSSFPEELLNGRSPSLYSIFDSLELPDEAETNVITMTLRYCRQRVLKPYRYLLAIIGWRPFFKDTLVPCITLWKVANVAYLILVVLLLIYYYSFHTVVCEGKLDPLIDTKPPADLWTTQPRINATSPTVLDSHQMFTSAILQNASNEGFPPSACAHIIPTYILPSLLHFMAFLCGFYHFRIQENEQLYALMERVFLQATSTTGTHHLLLRHSRFYFTGGMVWIFLHLGLEGLYYKAFGLQLWGKEFLNGSLVIPTDSTVLISFLLVFKCIGLLLVQTVTVTVILNYGTQCDMLVAYLQGICLNLREKTIDLKRAMHEILGVKEFVTLLNGNMGRMTALCVIYFIELTVIGTIMLLWNVYNDGYVWTYRACFVAIWFVALIFPLVQASRVSKIGFKMQKISLEARVFGYQTSSPSELDSFILFISNAKIRAKLFGVEIKPSTLIVTIGSAVLIMLLFMISSHIPITEATGLL